MSESVIVEKSFLYDAFISYNRQDESFAKKLEADLEKYRAPKDLALAKRRLNIFRDVYDLKGYDLSLSIQAALSNSKFLLLVCTPNATASYWVGKEIEYFSEVRGKEFIIPVLVQGRPNQEVAPEDPIQDQAFHESLLALTKEPLAAEYRDIFPTRGARKEAHNESLYQIKAFLFNVEKEELVRRQLRRRNRQILTGLVVALAFVIALSVTTVRAVTSERIADRKTAEAEAARDSTRVALLDAVLARDNEAIQRGIAEDERGKAEAAADTAEAARQVAVKAQNTAELARDSTRQALKETELARDSTEKALVATELARDSTEQARIRATNSRIQTLGLGLASNAKTEQENGNAELGALLARQAFLFNDSTKNEYPNEIYDALSQTVEALGVSSSPVLPVRKSFQGDYGVRAVVYASGRIVIANNNGQLVVYSRSNTMTPETVRDAHNGLIRALSSTRDGELLISASDDNTINIWEGVPDLALRQEFSVGAGPTWDVAISNRKLVIDDDTTFLVGRVAGDRIQVFKPYDGELLQSIAVNDTEFRALAFTSDDRILAGDTRGRIHLWDWYKDFEQRDTEGQQNEPEPPQLRAVLSGPVHVLEFSADGRKLAVAGEDASIKMLDWSSWQQGDPFLLRGHTGPIMDLKWADGRHDFVASSSLDHTIRLWYFNLVDSIAKPVDTFSAAEDSLFNPRSIILDTHSSWVWSIDLSADTTLISGSADRSAIEWRINPHTLVRDICYLVERDLTPEEWTEFVGSDITYAEEFQCKQ